MVIGGFAAIAQNVPIPPTMDIDFFPSNSKENLERLANALRVVDAKIRTGTREEGITFDQSADFLVQMKMLNLTCRFGDFDLVFTPAGFSCFEEVNRTAVNVFVMGIDTRVADIADIAKSKRAAGRAKDLLVLPIFDRMLRDLDRGEGDS